MQPPSFSMITILEYEQHEFYWQRKTMSSRVVPTSTEPTVVTVPAIRTVVYSISGTATTSAITTTVADVPTSVPTSTGVPRLPIESVAPVTMGNNSAPTITVIVLVAVVICALILLFALLYFIILRFQGKCQNCPGLENEIKKWKNGELKVITSDMLQERTRAWDLEKGAMDLQAQMYQDQMRMQTLAHLEGQVHHAQSSFDSLGSEDTIAACNKEQEVVKDFRVEDEPQKPIPTNVVAPVVQFDADFESTLVNDDFPKTYSMYMDKIVRPRQAAAKRLLDEALSEGKEHAIDRHLDIASDPANRESVQKRAVNKANELIAERAAKKTIPAPRKDGESRFKEHLSWATDRAQK